MRIIRFFWRFLNNLRRAFQIIIMLLLVILIIAGMSESDIEVPASAALVIAPGGPLVEQLEGDPLERALAEARGMGVSQTRLADVVDSLKLAADDDRIGAVVLALDGLSGGGLPKYQAITAALDKVRAAGKPIIAVGDNYTQDQYYLAAHADEIYLHPLGVLYLDGYGYYRTYLKNLLDKLKIDLNVFRVGKYKSFVEPFIRDNMSAEDEEASKRWLGALWSSYKTQVAKARGMEPDQVEDYINNFVGNLKQSGGNTAQVALNTGFVDSIASRREVRDRLIEIVGLSKEDEGTFSQINYQAYLAAVNNVDAVSGAEDRIGILVASGEIIDGEAPQGVIGGDTLAMLIEKAANDPEVKGLVLRVDSPGGSMFASEVVFEQLVQLKLMGKPLVVSMSTVAASGGYYISMLADEIWASESTITGSIGVGALLPTIQRSLDNVGINVDGFGTSELSGQFRLDRELGDQAREFLQMSVEDAYRVFVGKVASERGMSPERADNLAQGRVWIGFDAHETGLVDSLGGLDQAVASAAVLAGLEATEYDVKYIKQDFSFREMLAMELSVRAVRLVGSLGLGNNVLSGFFSEGFIGELAEQAGFLARLNDPRGIYLHCFCALP
ncbi:MAG: signal peptide peptidase SppA [Gammaproteobacteria bacterium]|nr:signal peptide peptidase SppA [Gammaproteobacteria bacterium]